MSLSRRLLAGGVALAAAGTALVASTSVSGAAAAPDRPRTRLPIVIAHRGASAYRPEESKHAYELAIEMGADYIEPDVVTTKDHVLVARHDNWLNDTTDVANHPEFASLKTTKTIDGVAHTDWFTEDFTFAQLRTLRLKERLPDIRRGSSAFDGSTRSPASTRCCRSPRSTTSASTPRPSTRPTSAHRAAAGGRAAQGPRPVRLQGPERQGLHPVLRDLEPPGAAARRPASS